MPDHPPAHTARPGDHVVSKVSLARVLKRGGLKGEAPWWQAGEFGEDGRLWVCGDNGRSNGHWIEPARYVVVHRPDDL
jgi:hypothetical protein